LNASTQTRSPRFFDLKTLYQTKVVLEIHASIRLYGAVDMTKRRERLALTIGTSPMMVQGRKQGLLQWLLGIARRSAVNAPVEACSARMAMSAWTRQA
jgi:hypothetical protein